MSTFATLRRFSGEEYSEISRRMTNHFELPREVAVGTTTKFLEEGLIHRTERGAPPVGGLLKV